MFPDKQQDNDQQDDHQKRLEHDGNTVSAAVMDACIMEQQC
jgi:hypothetical protein